MGGAVDSLGGFLGLSDGPKAPTAQVQNNPLENLKSRTSIFDNYDANRAMNDYSMGKMSLQDMLNVGNGGGTNVFIRDLLANDPLAGTKMATDTVQSNGILGQLFGKGGTMDRTGEEEQRLASQGFQLTPEDREAYGQASGDIARLFGQQENDLTQQLQSRGLASAGSGAAGMSFSGLAGNKNEQLAKAQTNIANQRMNNTMQRLGQTRQFLGQLGQQGAQAIDQQNSRQMNASQGIRNALSQAGNMTQNANDSRNNYAMQAAGFEQENKPKNFMDFATSGIGQGVQSGIGGGVGKQVGGLFGG